MSNQNKFIDTVVADIRTVTGWTSASPPPESLPQVASMDEPDSEKISFPGAMVFPLPEKEVDATNKQDDIGYGVGVIMAFRKGTPSLETIYTFRRAILKLYRNKATTTIGVGPIISHKNEITTGEVAEEIEKEDRFEVSEFSIHFFTRETR